MSVTTEQLNEMSAKIAELRSKEAELARQKKEITSALEATEEAMVAMLQESNLTSYKSEYGTVGLAFRSSVRIPQSEDDRRKFFEYLKSIGAYDSMITVNSQRLNAFYREELDKARDAGQDDFSIPGIEGVTINTILSFRSPK